MKKIILPILFLAVLLLPASLPADEAFTIERYRVDMDVHENNVYDITEVLDVNFSQERHGIIRTIPLKFDDMYVEMRDLRVEGYEFDLSRDGDYATIRIGSASKVITGDVTYELSYTYDVGADNLPDMDEFNHNIIGPEWDTVIKAVEFQIELPKDFDPSRLNCTSGPYGSTDSSNVEWTVNGTTITGRTKQPLRNYEALTVALPLPEGYWVGAVHHKKPYALLFTVLGYPLYGLVILLSFLLWFIKGRDSKLFPSVEFEPPENLNPAEVGYIIDGQVSNKDITSLIIYWAQKGLLAIEQKQKKNGKTEDLILVRTGQPGSDARSYEQHIFQELFLKAADDRVSLKDLRNNFYKTVNWGIKNVTRFFTKDPERRIYAKGTGGATLLTLVLAVLPIFLLLEEGLTDMMGNGPVPIIAFFVSLFMVIIFYLTSWTLSTGMSGPKSRLIVSLLMGVLLAVVGGVVSVLFLKLSLYKYTAAVISSFIAAFFASIMSRRTPYGDKILEKVLGFREFIKEAEKDKLEMMFASNPSYFYDILPYAIVLGLSDRWSRHFEGLAVEPPSWYRGHRYDRFNTRTFERDLNRNFQSLNSAMSSSPSGSSGSSSSGGFSGGGSGGGGGSSW